MFPRSPDDVTPDWLGRVLREAGLAGLAEVTAVAPSPVGTGQMATSVRYDLTWDRDVPGAPQSVIGKFASADPASRATGQSLRSYEVEVEFYRHVARTVDIRTPACYFADIDLATGEFVLVLEDLAPCVPGDQLAGCTPDQAALAMHELAKLHAPRWGDERLAAYDWLDRNNTPAAREFSLMFLPGLLPGFLERYGDRLESEYVRLAEALMTNLGRWMDDRPGPFAVQHGDYRLDNMLFGTADGGCPLAVVDWQTVVWGPPLADASYFIGAGLLPRDRRVHERPLLRQYYEELRTRGVGGLSWDDCWREYRRYAFSGFLMALAASMLVVQTERGDAMFLTMLRRHGAQIIDVEAEQFLSAKS